MTTDPHSLRDEAHAFLKEHSTGTLATLAKDGTPRARTVYFTADKSFNIYLVTNADTRKWEDVQANPKIAFVVSDEKIPRTVQIEGTIENLTNSALIDPSLVELTMVLMSNNTYFAPLTRFNPSDMVFLKITPSWIRWGDFSKGHGTSEVLHEIPVQE